MSCFLTGEIENMFGRLEMIRKKASTLWSMEKLKVEAMKYFNFFFKAQDQPSTNDQVKVAGLFSRLVTEAKAEALYRFDNFGGTKRGFVHVQV
jgi:hypothetical protein